MGRWADDLATFRFCRTIASAMVASSSPGLAIIAPDDICAAMAACRTAEWQGEPRRAIIEPVVATAASIRRLYGDWLKVKNHINENRLTFRSFSERVVQNVDHTYSTLTTTHRAR